LLLILVAFLYFVPVLHVIRFLGYCITYPFLSIQNSIIIPTRDYFRSHKLLRGENEILRQERDKLLSKSIKYKSVKNYYNNVKEIVEFKKNYNFDNAIFSQVLTKNFFSNENYFLLNQGYLSAVQKDMVAIYQNNLIGRITEVFPLYSKLILITDKSCKVAICCAKTKTRGIHRGNNSAIDTKLMYVSHLDKIQEDDILISSGEGLVFPQGFALGKIKSFVKKDVQFKIKVEPLVELSKIDYCYLVKKS